MPSKTIDPNDGKVRCAWAANDPILAAYHDLHWGKSIPDDAGHLQRIAQEIFQCGLSWKIVCVKTPALRKAFHEFKPRSVAAMTPRDVDRLCNDATIIRNRRKIEATIENARRFIALAGEHGSYVKWFKKIPAESKKDHAALMALFKKTFKFMGPETTKCYLMGVGKIPTEHEPRCFRAR